jgi:hypothetical protein
VEPKNRNQKYLEIVLMLSVNVCIDFQRTTFGSTFPKGGLNVFGSTFPKGG